MRPDLYCFSFALALGLHVSTSCQAQLADLELANPLSEMPAVGGAGFQPATLLKLGTGITRGLTIGGYMGTALPLVAGVERHYAPAWSVFGNVSSGWRIGARTAAPDHGTRAAYLTELGLDLGVRHYYNQEKRQAAGRATGPFVGNYVALQGSTSFTPNYAPKLYHQISAVSALWGTQHRLGGHGLMDAYVGGGLETRQVGLRRQVGMPPLSLHLEAGLKFSLVF
jgi:hypothetical protein